LLLIGLRLPLRQVLNSIHAGLLPGALRHLLRRARRDPGRDLPAHSVTLLSHALARSARLLTIVARS
jgi:hypothetical protein